MTRSEEFAGQLGRDDFMANLPDRGDQIFKRPEERDAYTAAYRRAMEEEGDRLRAEAEADVAERPSKKPPPEADALRQRGYDDAKAGRKPTWHPGGRVTPEGRRELPVEYMEGYRAAQEQMAKAEPVNEHRDLGDETDAQPDGHPGDSLVDPETLKQMEKPYERGGAAPPPDPRDGFPAWKDEVNLKLMKHHHALDAQRMRLDGHAEKLAGQHNRLVDYLARLEAAEAQNRNRDAQAAYRKAEAEMPSRRDEFAAWVERVDKLLTELASDTQKIGPLAERIGKAEALMHPPADQRPVIDARIRAALETRETCAAGNVTRQRVTDLEDDVKALTSRVDSIRREPDDGPPDLCATIIGRLDDHVERIRGLETDGVANARVTALDERLKQQMEIWTEWSGALHKVKRLAEAVNRAVIESDARLDRVAGSVRKAKKLARRALRLLIGRSSMTALKPPLLDQHYQDAAELRGRVRKLEEATQKDPKQARVQVYGVDGVPLVDGVLVQRPGQPLEFHVKNDHRPLPAEDGGKDA